MSLSKIKEYLSQIPIEQYPQIIDILKNDHRKTAQNLASRLNKKLCNHQKELKRLKRIQYYEGQAYARGYSLVAGIDEVGRGPLAGPVVSAAVILPKDCNILYINDSKKLSEQKREELYNKIKENAIDVGIGIVDPQTIDRINIYQATKKSMAIAVEHLEVKPRFILIDAMTCDNIPIAQKSIIKGDSKSISIAAASIIAKVTRDRIMEKYHDKFPQYAFYKNKGYGTEEHRKAIQDFGVLNIHRKSFLKNIVNNHDIGVEY